MYSCSRHFRATLLLLLILGNITSCVQQTLECALPGSACRRCGDNATGLLVPGYCATLSIVHEQMLQMSDSHEIRAEEYGQAIPLPRFGSCPDVVRQLPLQHANTLQARTTRSRRPMSVSATGPRPLRAAFAVAGLVPASADLIAPLQLARVVLPTGADVFASSWAVRQTPDTTSKPEWSLASELVRLLHLYCSDARPPESITSIEVLQPRMPGQYTWPLEERLNTVVGCKDQTTEPCGMTLDWVRRSFHLMSRSLALVREQEQQQGWRYDVVFRYRFDAVPLRKFVYPLGGLEAHTLYWSHFCCTSGPGCLEGSCPDQCPWKPRCWCTPDRSASPRRRFEEPISDIYGFGDSSTMETYGNVLTDLERYARMQPSMLPVQNQGFGWRPLPRGINTSRALPHGQALLLWSENLLAQHLAFREVQSVYHYASAVAVVREAGNLIFGGFKLQVVWGRESQA
ncbi:hypothetical protein CYMTET_42173 [Cymbomonas tetramitiformis]|uniref:Uncharacterized protein n=1 Tax=Cymbomonas tetramitiformis TaxID=36881 RepID=A0AAE0C4P6_9CHLO|nr:hypothetical protein CYMTET_42173 [Cymbomonas tetramitiformis]